MGRFKESKAFFFKREAKTYAPVPLAVLRRLLKHATAANAGSESLWSCSKKGRLAWHRFCVSGRHGRCRRPAPPRASRQSAYPHQHPLPLLCPAMRHDPARKRSGLVRRFPRLSNQQGRPLPQGLERRLAPLGSWPADHAADQGPKRHASAPRFLGGGAGPRGRRFPRHTRGARRRRGGRLRRRRPH